MADQLELNLPELVARETGRARDRSTTGERVESPASRLPEPVGCLWGCWGTTECLCGQGELSDDPVWIEND
jgi:hypothetical protein